MKISVSLLKIKDDLNKIKKVDESSTDYVHLDIMDGKFVPVKTDMYRAYSSILDVHLMVNDVKEYVDIYSTLYPEFITFHYEAPVSIDSMISYIHSKNIKVGLSICPDTPVADIIPYLSKVDLVLVMSVNPGFGGQTFIENSTSKINELYHLREENGYKYLIEVDGGINASTMDKVKNVDMAVIGSYITSSDDYEMTIKTIRNETR